MIYEPKWNSLDNESRYVLVAHEFGHCILDRDHDEENMEGNPLSIMYPSILGKGLYLRFEREFDIELANSSKERIKNSMSEWIF